MTEDNFWTDELVLEYAVRSHLPNNELTIQEFKKLKLPSETIHNNLSEGKDYEILSFRYVTDKTNIACKASNGYFFWDTSSIGTEKEMLTSVWKINSVRRLSDNSIWTVGDKTCFGVIEKFHLGWNGMEVHFTDGKGATLRSIEKSKIHNHVPLTDNPEDIEMWEGIVQFIQDNKAPFCQTLREKAEHLKRQFEILMLPNRKVDLVTTDGIGIHEGQTIWVIFTKDGFGFPVAEVREWKNYSKNNWDESVKTFSSKEKAQEYLTYSTKLLSLNDILSILGNGRHKQDSDLFKRALALAENQVNKL